MGRRRAGDDGDCKSPKKIKIELFDIHEKLKELDDLKANIETHMELQSNELKWKNKYYELSKVKDEAPTKLLEDLTKQVALMKKNHKAELEKSHKNMKELERTVEEYKSENVKIKNRKEELEQKVADLEQRVENGTAKETVVKVQQVSALSMELAKANKMIWCHELLTGFQIAMVENTEEDDDEYADKVTEVACTIQARNSTRKLVFELAIPTDVTQPLDYLIRQDLTTVEGLPSFFMDEISFVRSELPKFLKSIYNVMVSNQNKDPIGK